ncbi:MAG: ATP-binding protein [Chloroflexaceae bacterium]|nr:ATP-binding protein [Chloroflexaceae bacterium]
MTTQHDNYVCEPLSSDERLGALLGMSTALLVTQDTDAMLHVLVQTAQQVMAKATTVLLFLALPQEARMVLRAANVAHLPNLSTPLGSGSAGRLLQLPRAGLLRGDDLAALVQQLDEGGRDIFWRHAMEPPRCMLAVPLRTDQQRLGMLLISSAEDELAFQPHDLPFVQALADLAAVALVERQSRERAEALQRDLERTRRQQAEIQARLNVAQAQLVQSAKLAAVGELAASVAHEINNPLYAARNSLFLIEQELPKGSPQRPFLDIAQNELRRIANIVRRMRDFYRPGPEELQEMNLNDVVRTTLELMQLHLHQGQVTITAELAENLPVLTGHADQLQQVLLNLMLNACDAMPAGGTIHVTTMCRPALAGQPSALLLTIADTGTGVLPEHLPHLFEPFYTTKPNGTGLGLAISGHIINQHGGTISVESTPGEGAVFTIVLPLVPA